MVDSKYFVVMDADYQHPWQTVGEIAENLKEGTKVVIASRRKVEGYWSLLRKTISYFGNILGKLYQTSVKNVPYVFTARETEASKLKIRKFIPNILRRYFYDSELPSI